jgi:hypothetical protein
MGILVIFGTTAASIGCGLLLMWLACTALFGFLTRSERTERIIQKETENCPAALTHSIGGPQ